jgi:hypothetical protein
LDIDVLQAVQDSGEDLSLNNNLSQVDGVLGDLGKALADIPFKLGIRVGDQSGQVGNGTLVNDSLCELFSVFGDFRERSCCNTFECKLWLLNAENKEADSTSIYDSLCKLVVMFGDAAECKSSCFLHRWVELLKTVDERVKCT